MSFENQNILTMNKVEEQKFDKNKSKNVHASREEGINLTKHKKVMVIELSCTELSMNLRVNLFTQH